VVIAELRHLHRVLDWRLKAAVLCSVLSALSNLLAGWP
jgi:hypothetical protein